MRFATVSVGHIRMSCTENSWRTEAKLFWRGWLGVGRDWGNLPSKTPWRVELPWAVNHCFNLGRANDVTHGKWGFWLAGWDKPTTLFQSIIGPFSWRDHICQVIWPLLSRPFFVVHILLTRPSVLYDIFSRYYSLGRIAWNCLHMPFWKCILCPGTAYIYINYCRFILK